MSDTGSDHAGDTNLGFKTFLNGTLVSNIAIDTSQIATDTVAYVAAELGLAAEDCGGVAEALERALQIADEDDLVLVTGSLYVVGVARSLVRR